MNPDLQVMSLTSTGLPTPRLFFVGVVCWQPGLWDLGLLHPAVVLLSGGVLAACSFGTLGCSTPGCSLSGGAGSPAFGTRGSPPAVVLLSGWCAGSPFSWDLGLLHPAFVLLSGWCAGSPFFGTLGCSTPRLFFCRGDAGSPVFGTFGLLHPAVVVVGVF